MRALVLVDIQNDFCPGGALAVPEGDEVVPVANALSRRFELVVATQDWHPPGHGSFASAHPGRSPGDVVDLDGVEQVLWPDHCVQGTPGAEFHSGLDLGPVRHITRKGTDPGVDSYSAFLDNDRRGETDLDGFLKARGVDEIFVAGLATDYCVRSTALDGLGLGYRVRVVEDGCRGVELKPGDVATAVDEMRSAGARVVRSGDLE